MAKSFEDNITRLEEIVSQLERGDAKLADSLKLFEEGTKLVTSCGKMLDEAEQKVVRSSSPEDSTLVQLPAAREARSAKRSSRMSPSSLSAVSASRDASRA